MTPSAILFDMDDLLIHSAPMWTRAEETLLAALGGAWTPELAIQYKGMNALDVAATIHRLVPQDAARSPVRSVAECQQLLRSTLIDGFAGTIRAMPGAVDLVNRLYGRLPLAVASGSPLPAIEAALTKLGIRASIDQVISSESVARGKPHPDVFLAAAKALGVRPGECVVFEDSLIGVKAGLAAGATVYAIPSGSHDQIRALTPHVFASLSEVPNSFVPNAR